MGAGSVAGFRMIKTTYKYAKYPAYILRLIPSFCFSEGLIAMSIR